MANHCNNSGNIGRAVFYRPPVTPLQYPTPILLIPDEKTVSFMHESFHKDDDHSNYTRDWFAWQNTL